MWEPPSAVPLVFQEIYMETAIGDHNALIYHLKNSRTESKSHGQAALPRTIPKNPKQMRAIDDLFEDSHANLGETSDFNCEGGKTTFKNVLQTISDGYQNILFIFHPRSFRVLSIPLLTIFI